MKNRIKTCVTLATALITALCLASCGMFGGEDTTEKPSTATPSEMVSDVVDEIIPDKEDGKTVDENSDEYTADEKDGKSFMSDGARNGK